MKVEIDTYYVEKYLVYLIGKRAKSFYSEEKALAYIKENIEIFDRLKKVEYAIVRYGD